MDPVMQCTNLPSPPQDSIKRILVVIVTEIKSIIYVTSHSEIVDTEKVSSVSFSINEKRKAAMTRWSKARTRAAEVGKGYNLMLMIHHVLSSKEVIGEHFEDDHVATRFGNHLARLILRQEKREELTFEEGVKLLDKCLRNLLYRDSCQQSSGEYLCVDVVH
ncbi:proteasome subunit beta type-4-like protein [Tanacetum coccineum]